jgi:uncharacterized membrane protein
MSRSWRIVLSVEFTGAAIFYVFFGRYGSVLSQAIVLGQAGILFICTLRYMKHVEGRHPAKFVWFSLFLWGTAWAVESLGLRTGFLGAFYRYNSAHILSFGLGGVPIIVPTAWLVFGFLSGSIRHFLFDDSAAQRKALPSKRAGFFARSLVSGWAMLSVGFCLEWHFSHIAGFWDWQPAGHADSFLGNVPAGNFLLWFGVGLLIPFFEKITHAPRLSYKSRSLFLQALPTLGFGVLLLAGVCLNVVYQFLLGAAYCSASLAALAFRLISRFQIHRRYLPEPLSGWQKVPRIFRGGVPDKEGPRTSV